MIFKQRKSAREAGMFSFLRRQRDPEVIRAFAILDEAVAKLAGCGEELLDAIIVDAKSSITESKKDRDYFLHMVREKGESIQQWAYTFIINSAADQLESGDHHVYRGALGFAGTQYKAIFDKSIMIMVELGAYTNAWAETNIRAPVYESVRRMG